MNPVAALLSGGVDSAVALHRYIAKNPSQKSHITAYYLKIWLEDELSFLGTCPWEEDISYAEKVTAQLGVPLHIIPLQRAYHDKVVSYTLNELQQGGTPSPDVFCNQRIKFGAFLETIDDAATVISGHYGRIVRDDAHTHLHTARDTAKDQTYFLSHLDESQIQRIVMPIGELYKPQVRAYASEYTLAPAVRKDSQGICFLGKISYRDFVAYHLGERTGNIVDYHTKKILGTHNGTWFYTIGQRSGLGLGSGPWYVVSKSMEDNTLWVCHKDATTHMRRNTIAIEHIHWISTIPDAPCLEQLHVKLRHGPDRIPARLEWNADTHTGVVTLAVGDLGVAEGQLTVLYRESECLGCARIASVQHAL